MNIAEGLTLSPQDVIGESIAVLGIKGSGKTNTSAVVIEELAELGIPVTIVDPEGEYYGLKERYEFLIAGRGKSAEIQLEPEQAGALAQFSLQQAVSVILDMSNYDEETGQRLLLSYLESLFEAASELRKPYFLVIEEAHEYMPERSASPLRALLKRLALRGRKRGIGIIIVNQRSSNIAKDILTQAGIMLLHRVAHSADMTIYKDLIPVLTAKEVAEAVRGLSPGQCIYVRGDCVKVVQIRKRHTFHAGATPGLHDTPKLRRIDAKLLRQLQKAMGDPAAASRSAAPGGCGSINVAAEKDEIIRRLKDQVATLTNEIENYRRENVRLKAQQPTTKIEKLVAGREQKAPGIARQRQEEKLGKLLEFLGKGRRLNRIILAHFLQHNSPTTIRQLARKLAVDENNLYKNQPLELVRLGLLQRDDAESVNKRYQLGDIQALFPDLNSKQVCERILSSCLEGI